MKGVLKIFILSIGLISVAWIAPQKVSAQIRATVSFQIFYDNLSPYGSWLDNSQYGYVWVPRVSRGFTPYGTNGYWIFTDEGWTWVSNYSWGWAPFHYGRWFYDYYYGWIWVPDNEWGPAWVIWRRSEGYYGWAPIGPGISIDVAYSSGYHLPNNWWRFVRDRDFGRTDINNYYVSTTNYTTIISNSTVINNFREDRTRNVRYNVGPDRTEIEKHAGKTFTPIAIKESSMPAQNLRKDQLEIYRPQVQKNISAEQKPAPSKVVGWKRNQPMKQQPTQQPGQQQPTTQQPTKQQPAPQQPTKQQPTHQQQRQQQPTTEQPTKGQPTQQQSTNKQPSKPEQANPHKKGKD